jgi:hypothetical protein
LWSWLLIAVIATVVLYSASVVGLVVAGRGAEARAVAGFVPDCVVLFRRLIADERVPRRSKLLDAGARRLADDAVWTQPGTTRLSGTHRGRDAVVAFFLEVASYALVVRPLEYFGDGERVVAVVDVELAGERTRSIASPSAMASSPRSSTSATLRCRAGSSGARRRFPEVIP